MEPIIITLAVIAVFWLIMWLVSRIVETAQNNTRKINEIHMKLYPEKYDRKGNEIIKEEPEEELFFAEDWVQDAPEDEARNLIDQWLSKIKEENAEVPQNGEYKIGPAQSDDENMVGIYFVEDVEDTPVTDEIEPRFIDR
jgi:hypothetical protein